MKKAFFLLLTNAFLLLCAKAQDFNFSQFNELPLLRNPALAGQFTGDLKMTAVWRNQWNSITVPYKTQGLSGELKFPVRETTFGVGLQVISDKAGDSRLGRVLMAGTLAIHKPVSDERESYLSLGVTAEMVRQQFQESALRWNAQFVNGAYDPTAPSGQNFNNTSFPTLSNYADLNVGLMYNSVLGEDIKYYFGASGFHFLKPQRTFQKTVANNVLQATDSSIVKWMINGGISIPSSDYDRVILYSDFFMQGGAKQLQAGLLYKHDVLQDGEDYGISLSGGLFTRWGDALIPMVKLDYYKLAIGVTYDANLSKLSGASGGRGGFELTATFRSQLNIRNTDAAAVRCPTGF